MFFMSSSMIFFSVSYVQLSFFNWQYRAKKVTKSHDYTDWYFFPLIVSPFFSSRVKLSVWHRVFTSPLLPFHLIICVSLQKSSFRLGVSVSRAGVCWRSWWKQVREWVESGSRGWVWLETGERKTQLDLL